MKTLTKLFEAVNGGSWLLKSVKESRDGSRYIFRAETRFFQGFEKQNSAEIYASKAYADRLCRHYFGCKTSELKRFTYE